MKVLGIFHDVREIDAIESYLREVNFEAQTVGLEGSSATKFPYNSNDNGAQYFQAVKSSLELSDNNICYLEDSIQAKILWQVSFKTLEFLDPERRQPYLVQGDSIDDWKLFRVSSLGLIDLLLDNKKTTQEFPEIKKYSSLPLDFDEIEVQQFKNKLSLCMRAIENHYSQEIESWQEYLKKVNQALNTQRSINMYNYAKEVNCDTIIVGLGHAEDIAYQFPKNVDICRISKNKPQTLDCMGAPKEREINQKRFLPITNVISEIAAKDFSKF